MFEVVFLLVLALIWIIFATIQDIRKTEISDWLNFSLIIFALGFRFFYSLFDVGNFSFFYQGLIGFGIFFILGNLFYYSHFFAGGDAKLMIALGTVLPLSNSFFENVNYFIVFFVLFLVAGFFYSFSSTLFIALDNFKDFKNKFSKTFNKNRKRIYPLIFLGLVFILFGIKINLFFYLGFLIFLLPIFYVFAYSVEEACMIKKVNYNELIEGDWLYKDVKIEDKKIISKWDGLSKEEISLLKKNKKSVLIKKGIPFTPVFLISFIVFIALRYSPWNFNFF